MRSIAYTLLFVAALCLSVTAKAQKREDGMNLAFDAPPLGEITKATGWVMHPVSKKWIDNPNLISVDKFDDSKDISRTLSNFSSIKVRPITYENKKYYVFYYEHVAGFWKYKIIKQDWISADATDFAIVTEKDYLDFSKKIKSKNGKDIILKTYSKGSAAGHSSKGGEQEVELMSEITKMFRLKFALESLVFNSQTVDGKDVVRFRLLLPDSYIQLKTYFNDMYFECPYDDFSKILL